MTLSLKRDCGCEVYDNVDPGYVGIYVVQLNKSDESQIISNFASDFHRIGESIFTFPQDGYYTIARIVLPTRATYEGLVKQGTAMYFVDEDSTTDLGYKIYKVNNPQSVLSQEEEVDVVHILEVNTENTNIDREMMYYFSTCYLYKCYVNICKELYENLFSASSKVKCPPCKTDIDTNLKYKRDLVQSTLSVLQYLVDCDQLAEAQRILERIGSCNGICPTADKATSDSRCGCQG